MVAGQDHYIIGIIALNKVDVLINRVSCALVPVGLAAALIRRQDAHTGVHTVEIPRLAAAYVLVEQQGLVLGKDAHALNAGIHTVRERKVDNTVFATIWNSGFCQVFREHAQPAALAACKEHGDDFLFWHHNEIPPWLHISL